MENTIENHKKLIDELQDAKRSYDSLRPLFLAEDGVLDRLVQLYCKIKKLETEIEKK